MHLRNIGKIFWWLYIHAEVILQPVIRLQGILSISAQDSLCS